MIQRGLCESSFLLTHPAWLTQPRLCQDGARYDRSKLRYPSDLTDDEWAHVEPLIPPAKRGGNKRHVEVRQVMNGIMYILSTGCQWRAIPKDLPPRSTLFDYLDLWSYDGTLDRIHHALYVACREQGEREASPSAAIVDSQSVKSAEKGGVCTENLVRFDLMTESLNVGGDGRADYPSPEPGRRALQAQEPT